MSKNAANDKAITVANDALSRLSEALAAGRSETLTNYLVFMARFHRYSWLNTLLILFQRSDATMVAGFNRWKEMGRFVKKGEKGIAILIPIKYRSSPTRSDKDLEDEENGKAWSLFRQGTSSISSQRTGNRFPSSLQSKAIRAASAHCFET